MCTENILSPKGMGWLKQKAPGSIPVNDRILEVFISIEDTISGLVLG